MFNKISHKTTDFQNPQFKDPKSLHHKIHTIAAKNVGISFRAYKPPLLAPVDTRRSPTWLAFYFV